MLSRRIVGPRNVVMAWDPAVDAGASDVEKYRDALWDFDAGHVKLKAGEKATTWRIGPMTEAQKRRSLSFEADSPEWTDFVFACTCHGVTNYPVIGEDGAETDVIVPERKNSAGLGDMLPLDWVRGCSITHRDMQGAAIIGWELSEARGPLSKPSAPHAGP